MTNDALKALDRLVEWARYSGDDAEDWSPECDGETIRTALTQPSGDVFVAENGLAIASGKSIEEAIGKIGVAGLLQPKADVEGLANYIRAINGDNTMGAGELAEKITDHLAARGCLGVPEGYALVPIDLLHKAKVLINFHVKRGACIDINDKLFNEGEIYSELNKLWAQAWAKDAPKKEGV